MGLNPSVTTAALAGVEASGRDIKVASFDIDADVLAGIQDGTILFTVDQQQYLQGYLPVTFLKLFLTNANTVGGGQAVLTGPGFVDKNNAATIEKLAADGTR